MPTSNLTKQCSKCKLVKNISNFHKDKTKPGGYSRTCIDCKGGYFRSSQGRAVRKKANLKYSKKQKGKEAHKRADFKKRHIHPQKMKARQAVKNAIRSKLLPRPNTLLCECLKQANEYHHLDYASKAGLNVIPVCSSCHKTLHRK